MFTSNILTRATVGILFCLFSLFSYAEQTPEISQQQVVKLLEAPEKNSFVILDVRSPDEFNQGHINGAINIAHHEIETKHSQLSNYKNSLVIVHCRSGRRAVSAENTLKEQGFTNVQHLAGDMNAWQDAKLPLITKP
jgi:rhodanese-related sulfurtransferase